MGVPKAAQCLESGWSGWVEREEERVEWMGGEGGWRGNRGGCVKRGCQNKAWKEKVCVQSVLGCTVLAMDMLDGT